MVQSTLNGPGPILQPKLTGSGSGETDAAELVSIPGTDGLTGDTGPGFPSTAGIGGLPPFTGTPVGNLAMVSTGTLSLQGGRSVPAGEALLAVHDGLHTFAIWSDFLAQGPHGAGVANPQLRAWTFDLQAYVNDDLLDDRTIQDLANGTDATLGSESIYRNVYFERLVALHAGDAVSMFIQGFALLTDGSTFTDGVGSTRHGMRLVRVAALPSEGSGT